MAQEIDWRNFDQKELEKLPFVSRKQQAIFIGGLCIVAAAAVGWFKIKPTIESIEYEVEREVKLRSEFETVQGKAANLEAYRAQLAEMKDSFEQMLTQLPNSTQIPGLLREVAGLSRNAGLNIETFRPLEETARDFYVEHGVQLVVVGTFNQFAQFASDLANTSRIVNMLDYKLTLDREKRDNAAADPDAVLIRGDLRIATYRYAGGEE